MAGKKAKGPGAYALEQDVPQVIAVLPASVVAAQNATDSGKVDPEDAQFVGNLTRSILQNHLAGKGYQPMLLSAVDRKLHAHPDWQAVPGKELCKVLGVQGVVYLDISGWAMLNVAAVENFMLSASARMVEASGREIGTWIETADKQRFSIPTSLIGIAGTVAGAFLSDSPKKQFRHVVYDWGWKMAQIMPDCLKGKALPEIMMVDSNADIRVFGAGEKVAVKVFAENDLIASFDIGDFKKNISLKMVAEGEYEGFYVVRQGDKTQGQLLTVRVARPNGAEREWIEPEALLDIDGVPPLAPERIVFQAQNDGVHINWQLPEGDEVFAFVVERNDNPVGEFRQIARIEDAKFVDGEVEQGMTYYYRIRAVDGARNMSMAAKPEEVVMPRFEEMKIHGIQTGSLVTGNYFVENDITVPSGEVLTIMRGTKLIFAEGTLLDVVGKLIVKGEHGASVSMVGEKWLGLSVQPGAEATLSNVSMKGCSVAVKNAGRLFAESVNALGYSGEGFVLSSGHFELNDVDLTGWTQAVLINGGEGVITKSSFTGNEIGLAFVSGELELDHNNIHENAQNIVAETQLAVRGNYLGSTVGNETRVSAMVILKSVLDAPYPDGRLIALMEDEDLTAEQITRRFEEHKVRGVELFNERKYGDAYAELSKAVRFKADRDAYLYLAYTQMELGEIERVGKTMEAAIEAFPYDYRLQQVYVRHLLAQGEDRKAMIAVDEALKLDPGNVNLQFLKEYVVEEVRKLRAEPAIDAP